jgi:hypothetical protein
MGGLASPGRKLRGLAPRPKHDKTRASKGEKCGGEKQKRVVFSAGVTPASLFDTSNKEQWSSDTVSGAGQTINVIAEVAWRMQA